MLESPDTFHLSAAIGWLELGNPLEANQELDKITASRSADPEVLSVRQDVYWSLEKWAEVDAIARSLIKLQPKILWHWTNLAYAARRKPGGSILEAKEILLAAAQLFPADSLICYNLCCYESQLGNLPQAKAWLDKAYAGGDRQELQHLVQNDPDLDPLRKEFNLSS